MFLNGFAAALDLWGQRRYVNMKQKFCLPDELFWNGIAATEMRAVFGDCYRLG